MSSSRAIQGIWVLTWSSSKLSESLLFLHQFSSDSEKSKMAAQVVRFNTWRILELSQLRLLELAWSVTRVKWLKRCCNRAVAGSKKLFFGRGSKKLWNKLVLRCNLVDFVSLIKNILTVGTSFIPCILEKLYPDPSFHAKSFSKFPDIFLTISCQKLNFPDQKHT